MSDLSKCPACGASGMMYYPDACNEAGWRCPSCDHRPGEPAGFDPWRDRELIDVKVHCLLLDVHTADLTYVSNNDHADGLVGAIARHCREVGRYDQITILSRIFDQPSHGDYWAKISTAIVEGRDERERCPGGRLATMHSAGAAWCGKSDCEPCSNKVVHARPKAGT